MKSIVPRDTQQGYSEYLKRSAQAEGAEASDAEALRRMDRKLPTTMRNEDWVGTMAKPRSRARNTGAPRWLTRPNKRWGARIEGGLPERGERLQAGQVEQVVRNFAHQFDTGGTCKVWGTFTRSS